MTIGSDVNPPRRRKERRTNNAHQAQWQFQADLLDQLSDAVIAVDLDECITYLNRAAVAQYGVDPASAIGQPLSHLYRYEWLQPEDEMLADVALNTEGRWRGENRHIRQDGSILQVESMVTLLRDATGNPTGLLATMRDITDRKQMERDLRASELRYRRLADTLPQLVWSADVVGVTDYYNIHIHDFDPSVWQGAKGFDWESLLHPDDLAPTLAAWQEAVTQRRPYTCEHRLHMADGSWRWHLSRALLVQDSENGLRWYGTATDIHERKMAEEALRTSEERYRTLFERMEEGFCVFEMIDDDAGQPIDYRFLEVNPAFARFTGLENAVGKTAYELVPNLEPNWVAIYGEVARTGKAHHFIEGSAAMGRWFEVYAFRFGGPESRRVALLFTNVTERKLTEDALRDSEEELRYTVELNPQVPWTADAAGNIISFNQRWLDLTGLTEERALGGGWVEAPHPDDRLAMVSAWSHAIQSGEPYDIEHRIRLAAGDYRWMRSRAFPRRDKKGEIVRWYGTTEDIHERKTAEAALRASEAALRDHETRLQTILQNIPASVYMLTTDQRYLYVNRYYEQLANITNAEIQGKSIYEMFDPATAAALAANDQRALAAKAPLVLEEFAPQHGKIHTYASIKTPLLTAEGEPYALIGISTDITERKGMEEALRTSEARLRQLADAMPQIVWQADATGQNLYFNQRWLDYTGMTPAESLADANRAIHPADQGEAVRQWQEMRPLGKPYEFELRLRRADGLYRWHLVRCEPVYNTERQLLCWYGTSTDIHDRKEAELALQQSEANFRTLANSVPSIIWTAAPDGAITYANDQWFEYCGLTPEENARAWPQLVLHPDDFERCVTQWSAALASGEAYAIEVRNRRYDGVYRWFLTRAIPMRDAAGQITAWFGATTDIDERKQAELNQQLLDRISLLLAESVEKDVLMWRVARQVGEFFDGYRSGFADIDMQTGTSILHHDWTAANAASVAGKYRNEIFLSADFMATLRNNEAVVVADVTQDPRTAPYADHWAPFGIAAFAFVPIVRAGEWTALFFVHLAKPHPWRAEEVQLLRDVTARVWPAVERMRTEQALRTSEERLRLATEAGGVGIFDHDLITNQTEISAIYAQITGLPLVETMPREAWLARVHPEDRSMVEAIWENAKATGASYYYECRLIRPDGALVWIEVNAWVTPNAAGQGIRITGAIRDITERKQAALHQQFLLNLNSSLRTLTDADAIQQTVVERLGAYLGVDRCRFNAIDLAADKATLLAVWSRPGLPPPADITPLSAHTPAAYIASAQAGRTLVVHNVGQDEQSETAKTLLLSCGYAATIRVPCLREGQWVATLHVLQTTPRPWRSDEVQLVENVVHHFWPLAEKARAEAEVRRANERFTLAEAAVPGWIYDYDWQTGAVMRSNGFARVLGYAPEECQPTAAWWQSLIHPDDWQWLAQEIGSLSPQGDLRLLEYRVRDRDGHYHYIWDRAHVMRDESGAMIRLVGSSVDISERKQAEAALQQSNAILSGVLESSNDAIFVRDLAGRYLLVNNAGAAQVGLPKGALIGRRYQEVFDAATVATMDTDDRPVLTQGITVTLEHVNEQHGVMRYWHTLKTPLRNADGAITGLISSARDFTERKAMEDALRRNEARFIAVQQATPDGYMIFESVRDEQGVIRDFRWLYLNPASEQMVGRTAADLVGKYLLAEMPGNREEGLFDAYVQVVETGAVSQREFCYQHDGIDRWFRNTAAKAGDGFAVAFSDITARRQAEVDQQVLADLAEQIRVADDADELVAATVRLLGDHLRVGRCLWIELYGAHQRGAVRAQHCRGLPPVAEAYEQADYSPATRAELAAGRVLVNHDAQQDPRTAARYATVYAPYQERAYVGVPFLREGVWRGILSVTTPTPRQWQTREISLLETVAERVWLAVDKLRLVAELRANEARYRTIFDHAGVSLWEEDFSRVKQAVDELTAAWRAAGVTDLAAAMRAHCAAHPDFVQAMLERVRILNVNAETVRLYGRPKAELLRPLHQHFVPETLDRFINELALIASGGQRYTFDGPVETPQGEVRHVAFTVVFPSEADGDFTRVLLSGLDVTALKAAEVENRRLFLETQSLLAQVQEGERFLQSIADTIPNVIYLFDLRTMRNRYANRHLTVTLGYTAAEAQALGDQFIPALLHPDDQRYLADHLTHLDALADGEMADWEYRMKHKGGEWRWLTSREIVFERDEQGRPAVILGALQDSTARKEAEMALRASEARFRHLAEAMPQVVWTCQADGSLTYINQQWSEYSGIAPAVTLAEGMWPAMHPADQAANREQWRQALTSGEAYEGEVRLQRQDGVYRWFLERAIPVRDEGGAIQQWFGLSMEIHDRKEAEQRQAELVALLEALLANAPVGFAFLDREQRFVRINQMLAEQHGRPIADHLGRTFAEIAPRAAKTTSPILAQVLTTGAGIYNREISGPKLANPNEIIHALASWFPVAVNGVTQYVGSMIVDITERKRQERHQQFLSELGMDLRLLSDTTTIVTQVVSRLGDYLQVAGCRINEVDQQRAQFTLQKDWVAADAPWAAVVTPGVYPLRELAAPALLAALQAGQTVVVTNTLHDSRTALVAETYETDQVHSLIGVPIFHQNEWRATLSVKGYGERHWRPDEVALVEAVASQLSALLEKVRAEEALRTSEERLRLALAGGGMGIWESQVATNRSIWSPEEYALFGLAPDVEITNALFNTLVHPDDLPGLQAALTHLIAAGSDHTGEFRIIRPDGAVRWLADRVTVIRDESGQPVRLLGINFDITERKEREAMIRQQLAEIEAIYATAPVGLCLVDRDLRYVRINETLATINGSTIAEQLGRTLAETQPAEGYRIIEPLYRGVIETGIPLLDREVHESYVDPAQARDWLASYYPLKNAEGVVTGVNAVILEITERKRQERQLQELNASLEERVLERTRALAQANRELEQFTYAAAHDLRTPLRGIANLVQWISEDAAPVLSPESQRHLDKLGGRVKRLEKMLEDLLAYSRVGRVRYQPETVDVQQLVQSLLDLLAPTGFVVKASTQLPTFTALRVPLELVFRNLLSNAIRHHHDPTNGQAEITVRELDDWYEFCISDNGPGIDPQYHERIFGMFQTLKPRDQVEGSGIGLALVKKTVESVGGQIRMASALGQGTAFYFTWPKG